MKRRIPYLFAILLIALFLNSCSDDNSSTDGGGAVTLSGTLTGRLQAFHFPTFIKGLVKDFKIRTGTATTVSCATADNPPTVVTGAVNNNGTFSVDLSSVSGKGVTCSALDGAGNVVGTFLYENSEQKSFGGGNQTSDTVPFTESKNLGSLSVSAGQISVDADSLGVSTSGLTVAAAQAFDPTGLWTIGAAADTLPPGYIGPCAPGAMNCHGPTAGETIYIKRTVGKKFTPNGACQSAADAGTFSSSDTCVGTTGTDDAFVFSIWMSQTSFNACGDGTKGALGFNEAQAKAYGHIDFSSDSSTVHDAFNYSTVAGASNITDGWIDSEATSSWSLMNCFNVVSGSQTAWKCLDNSGHYSLSLGGGCAAVNGDPFQPDDWSNMKWGSGSCSSNSPVTFDGKSLASNTCTVPYWPGGVEANAINLTCSNTWGAFNVADDLPYNGAVNPEVLLASGAKCITLPTGGNPGKELQQLQCYANYFFNNQSYANDVCLRQIRTDWGATTPTDFILNDGPGRPRNMALTEKATYLTADVATFTQFEDDYRGVQVQSANGSSWLSCRMKAKNTITVTKANDAGTQMLIKFVQESSLADTKTGCVAAASDASSAAQMGIGELRMLFKMTK